MSRVEIKQFWIEYFELDYFGQKDKLDELLSPLYECIFALESKSAIKWLVLSSFRNYIEDVRESLQ